MPRGVVNVGALIGASTVCEPDNVGQRHLPQTRLRPGAKRPGNINRCIWVSGKVAFHLILKGGQVGFVVHEPNREIVSRNLPCKRSLSRLHRRESIYQQFCQ